MPHVLTDTPATYDATAPTRVAVALRYPSIAGPLARDPTLAVTNMPSGAATFLDARDLYDIALIDAERCEIIAEAFKCQIAIIAVSEWGQEIETAYAAGCDYFLLTPLDSAVVRAYIRAWQRRQAITVRGATDPVVAWGPFRVDCHQQLLFVEDQPIFVGARGSRFMAKLVAAAGDLVPLCEIKPIFRDLEHSDEGIRYTTRWLRRKLRFHHLDLIEHIHMHGYRLKVSS